MWSSSDESSVTGARRKTGGSRKQRTTRKESKGHVLQHFFSRVCFPSNSGKEKRDTVQGTSAFKMVPENYRAIFFHLPEGFVWVKCNSGDSSLEEENK